MQRVIGRSRFAFGAAGLSAALLFILAGCGTQAKLTPAPGAKEVTGQPYAAVSNVDSVDVLAEPNVWIGRPEVLQDVTPVRITIHNNSTRPVRVRYTDFSLVGPKGVRYAALPPIGVHGTVQEPVVANVHPPVEEPEFDEDGFDVAPYLGPMYPTLVPWHGPFYYDPLYYDNYYTYWQSINLPTREMVREALPEGVVEADGHISGFLYFQKVNPREGRVVFRDDLVNAKTGNIFGTVTIPFRVHPV
jgi:hypothetical protein